MSLNDPDYDFYTMVQSLSQIWQVYYETKCPLKYDETP